MGSLYDGELELLMGDYVPDGGEVKSDIPKRLAVISRSKFTVSVARLHEVHGNFEPTTEDDASLVVLKVEPRLADSKRCFKSLKITLVLKPASDSDGNAVPPFIKAYEPSQDGDVWFTEQTTTVTKTRSLEGQASAQAPVGGASAGITASGSRSEESQKRVRHTLSSNYSWDKEGDEPDMVWWQVKPADQTDGVGDSIGIALLVQRAKGSKFEIAMDAQGEVGTRAAISDSFHKRGFVSLGMFGPGNGAPQQKPEKVDDKNLHACSTEEILKELSFLHLAEKVSPKTFHNVQLPVAMTEMPTLNQPTLESMSKPKAPSQTSMEAVGVVEDAEPKKHGLATQSVPLMSATNIKRSNILPNARADRHRKMASLYQRLAELHREEAEEAQQLEDIIYADEVQRTDG